MALSALTWRQLPAQTLTSGYTIANMLDAVYTAFTSTTYANGAARTQGSGLAWTTSRYQNAGTTEAVYMTPVSNALNQAVIIGGASTARTPTMAAGVSAFAVNYMLMGINKNSGAFASWTAALPFTSGQFSGYSYFAGVQAQNQTLRCYESQDGILITNNITATGTYGCYGFAGGLVDPETGNTGTDAESDGKLYVLGTGYPTTQFANFDGGNTSGAAASSMFAHHYKSSSATSQSRMLAFTPGSGTMLAMARQQRYAPTGSTFATRSGQYARTPITLLFTDSTLSYTDPPVTWAGRLREMCLTKTAAAGTTLRNSGTDVGYYLSDNAGALANSVILSY